ncbi:MAG: GNAT family N-acetyltransferase [Candidatus Atribacteria bacterium]|nr:GNAT family N-acetyltransferase [Candidatus Atribacteria bacterium]
MEIIRETYETFPKNAEFLKKIFPKDDEKYYYSFLKYHPFFTPYHIYSIKGSNQTLATLWCLPCLFIDNERMILAAGIANVATDPDFRGQGLAGQLMEKVLKEAEIQKYKFLILITEIPEYYKRWGFQEIGKYEVVIESPAIAKYPITCQNITYENILDTYRSFYQDFQMITPFHNLAYMRGREEWNQWSSMFHNNGGKAGWFLLKNEIGHFTIFYGLDREEYFKVFEIIWDKKIDKKGLLMLFQDWAYHLGKEIHLDLSLPVANYLGLKASKDPKETVMVKSYGDIDINRIYLPVPDYF